MNRWWLLFVPLGCLWAIPMYGARVSGMSWFFFAAVGAGALLAGWYISPLYDAGTSILRGLGLSRLADWRAGLKPRLIGPARGTLFIASAISLAFAILAA